MEEIVFITFLCCDVMNEHHVVATNNVTKYMGRNIL